MKRQTVRTNEGTILITKFFSCVLSQKEGYKVAYVVVSNSHKKSADKIIQL